MLLFHKVIVETEDSSDRGMNPVAMTIINPRKEYWPRERGEHGGTTSLADDEFYDYVLGITNHSDALSRLKSIA